MPRALQERPEEDEIISHWLDLFYTLLSRRNEGRIQISEMKSYCEIIGETDVDFFMRVISYVEQSLDKIVNEDKSFSEQLSRGNK